MTTQNTKIDCYGLEYGYEPHGPNAGIPTVTIRLGSKRSDGRNVNWVLGQLRNYNWLKAARSHDCRFKFAPQEVPGRPSDPLDKRHTESILALTSVIRPQNVVIETFFPSRIDSEIRRLTDEFMYRQEHDKIRATPEAKDVATEIRHGDGALLPVVTYPRHLDEFETVRRALTVPQNRVWYIPSGDSLDEVQTSYGRLHKQLRGSVYNLSPCLTFLTDPDDEDEDEETEE